MKALLQIRVFFVCKVCSDLAHPRSRYSAESTHQIGGDTRWRLKHKHTPCPQ